jgi:hypothetical protein
MQPKDVADRPWEVDTVSEPGTLRLVVRGRISPDQMRAFVAAHNAAIDSYRGADYKVLCDIRALVPLSPECAEIFAVAKTYSDSRPNFRGSAVWVDRAVVAMQHARTSKATGVSRSELISSDEAALRAHLATVWRK